MRPGRRRSYAGSSSRPPGTPATRPRAWRRSFTPRAATPMADIPTSTNCSSNRPANGLWKREALLHRIQQLTIDRVMFAPIWNTRVVIGVGPRVAAHTINLLPMSIWPSYEDIGSRANREWTTPNISRHWSPIATLPLHSLPAHGQARAGPGASHYRDNDVPREWG